MTIEHSKLGITSADVERSMERYQRFGTMYTGKVMIEMAQKQTPLFEFIYDMADRGVQNDRDEFLLGASLTFDQLSPRHVGRIITADELIALKESLAENIKLEGVDDNLAPIDVSSSMDRLRDDSFTYNKWLFFISNAKKKEGCTQGQIYDHIMGSFVVALAFYRRVEAEELEQKFSNL